MAPEVISGFFSHIYLYIYIYIYIYSHTNLLLILSVILYGVKSCLYTYLKSTGRPYSESADMYSVGIIAWELLTGKCPFDGMNTHIISINMLYAICYIKI